MHRRELLGFLCHESADVSLDLVLGVSVTCHCGRKELLDCPAGLGGADETPETVNSLGEMLGVVLQTGRVQLGQAQQI